MSAMAIGSIVSYQGRCWLVTRVAGAWLHIITPAGHSRYHSVDVPRTEVSLSLRSPESGHAAMYCPLSHKS